jgi:glycosyl transferase, family 25
MQKIDATYVVHAKKGYEMHEKHVINLLAAHNLPFEFMTDGDPSLFTDELIYKYFIKNIKEVLSTGVLSCTLNHILCYEQIVKNGHKYTLILENDPFFLKNFDESFAKIITEASTLPAGQLISIENTTLRFPKFKTIRKDKLLYEAKAGRFAGAYLIDLQAAEDILAHLKTHKCHTVIDWWHNSLIDDDIVKMYWAYPAITEQGSHNGLMSSTISTKNKNLKRQIAWQAQKFYKTYILRYFL